MLMSPFYNLIVAAINVAVIAGQTCERDGDCYPRKPFCVNGICQDCTSNSECDFHSSFPWCIDGECWMCRSNDDCSSFKPFCLDKLCVQCIEDSDCDPPSCNSRNTCDECASDADCSKGSCEDGICITCFAPHSQVMTETRGKIKISELKVNEKVLTASGDFKTVFAFSTFATGIHTFTSQGGVVSYVRIATESSATIEMTPRHMIYVKDQKYPIEASKIKPGDFLLLRQKERTAPVADRVISVESIYLNGGISPVTEDGTIVVDDIIASCYSNPLHTQGSEYVASILGISVVHRQVFTHILKSPIRLFCTHISDSLCQVSANKGSHFGFYKMPGHVLLDNLHEFAVKWGIQDLAHLLVGAIALCFYTFECVAGKMGFPFTLGLVFVLYRFVIRSSKTSLLLKKAN